MAADSLKAKAAEMGVDIKVETNGSGGAKNVLTAEEIENAEAIIVAADKRWRWNALMESMLLKQQLQMEFVYRKN